MLTWLAISVLMSVSGFKRQSINLFIGTTIICILPLIVPSFFTFTQAQVETHVRLIHGVPDQYRKQKRYYRKDRIEKYLTISQEAPIPSLIIWPESAIPTTFETHQALVEKALVSLEAEHSHLLLGSYLNKGSDSYNALIYANQPEQYYLKKHIIPFGEYTPDFNLMPSSEVANSQLSTGELQQATLKIGEHIRLGGIICFEILFPDELREQWSEANVLVYISDMSWFQDTQAIDYFLALSRIRALESGKPLLASTSHAVSAIINADGSIQNSIRQTKRATYVDGEIMLMQGATPFTRFGHWPVLGICIFGLLLLWRLNHASS